MSKWVFVLATCVALLGSGCAQVNPWEREILARPDMAWQPDELEASYRGHVFFSKEGALPASAAGGGGCGCN